LTVGEDIVDPLTWAGSVPVAHGIAPRVRVDRTRWFNLLWLLPIGFVALLAGIATAKCLRGTSSVQHFIATYPGATADGSWSSLSARRPGFVLNPQPRLLLLTGGAVEQGSGSGELGHDSGRRSLVPQKTDALTGVDARDVKVALLPSGDQLCKRRVVAREPVLMPDPVVEVRVAQGPPAVLRWPGHAPGPRQSRDVGRVIG